jgi:hypothetical protein
VTTSSRENFDEAGAESNSFKSNLGLMNSRESCLLEDCFRVETFPRRNPKESPEPKLTGHFTPHVTKARCSERSYETLKISLLLLDVQLP